MLVWVWDEFERRRGNSSETLLRLRNAIGL
jgi:hypothetical protein